VIAGTGSGKSLVYQAILAVSEKAIVLVVSPTLALIRDQVCTPQRLGF
jgi:superfamily II DNA helicase RecQ